MGFFKSYGFFKDTGTGSSSSGECCVFDTTEPVPESHGGLSAGTIINGLTTEEVLLKILYPYQYPAFSSFYIEGQTTILEVGDKVVGGSRNFIWSTINDSNIQPNSIEIKDATTNVVLGTNLDNDGNEILDIGSDIVNTSASSHSWSISGVNTKGGVFSRSFVVNWRYRVYWGSSEVEAVDETTIKDTFSSALKSGFAGTYNYTYDGVNKYYYVIYPDVWGDINQAIDCDNNFGWDMLYDGTLNITNDFGVTTTYRRLRTTYKQGSDGCVVIS